MFPIVGATASVRDRHDVDVVLTNPVHDVVRESVHTQLAARSSRRPRHADQGSDREPWLVGLLDRLANSPIGLVNTKRR